MMSGRFGWGRKVCTVIGKTRGPTRVVFRVMANRFSPKRRSCYPNIRTRHLGPDYRQRAPVVHDEVIVRREALEQVRHGVVRRGREREVDVREQRVGRLPPELLPQELDDRLEPVRRCDLVEVLLHDRRIPDGLEPNDD
jgi:hypothetical protein